MVILLLASSRKMTWASLIYEVFLFSIGNEIYNNIVEDVDTSNKVKAF